MPNMKSLSLTVQMKVIAKVKVDNRQTNRQTNIQDKNNMPPIVRSGGIKNKAFFERNDAKSGSGEKH